MVPAGQEQRGMEIPPQKKYIHALTSGGRCCRDRGGGSWPGPGSSQTSPARGDIPHETSAPGRRAAPPARGQGTVRGVTGVPPPSQEPGQGDWGVWYLQVLDGPLDAPAVVLQGCLALLSGHTVYRVLHLRGACGQCPSPPPAIEEPVAGAGGH